MSIDRRAVLLPVSIFLLPAACLLFTGCGALPGAAGGLGHASAPFGWNLGKGSLAKAVENDPFPEAAEVGLEI